MKDQKLTKLNKEPSVSESLAQAIRWGNFLTHCPTCREIVSSVGFLRLGGAFKNDLWPSYKESGCQRCYCSNCHHFLDGWFRSNLPDYSDAEVDVTVWTENKVTGRWEAMGSLFGNPRSKEAENGMNEMAKEKRWLFKAARFWRSLSGSCFVKDEKRFSVAIPLSGRTPEAAEKLIAKIKTKLRVKRAGRLKRVEVIDDTLWGHFDDKMIGASHVLAMWRAGQLPADVTVWSYNEGRRFQNKAWDSKTETAAVHPSLTKSSSAGSAPAPSSRLPKNASIEQAIAWLSSRLSAIEENNEEIGDSLISERIIGLLEDNFINDKGCSKVPNRFGLDDSNAEMRLKRALTTFLATACVQEARLQLSSKQRAELLVNGGEFLEDVM